MIDFTKVPNIHYWTQRVLPCVFDESLSYVEKINKLEEEINKLIEDYNTFGQAVTNEINTFEEETTNQINTFIQQVTNEINTFKSDITNQLNTFETSMTNKQNAFEARILELTQDFETTINNDIATFKQTITTQQQQFETRVNNDINTMQEVVNEIPNTVTTQVNAITQPWLVSNVPTMVESSVANNVNKVFDVDTLIYVTHDESIEDLNNWTTTGIYYGTSLSILSNYPSNIVSGDMYWCFVGHTGTNAVERTIQQTLYLNDGSCFTRAYVNTSNAWDLWIRVSNTFRNIDSNSTVDFNTFFFTDTNYGLNDTWIGVYNPEKWSNVPSNLINGDVVKVNIYHYFTTSNSVTVQVISKIYSTSNHFTNIGKTWSRKGVSGTFSSWNPTTLDYQYKEILTNTQLNDLTETGIYTISSESGVTIGGLPSTALQYGSFYIRVTANNIGTNSDEIIQEIINAGPGASSYTREKQGAQWSNWSKTRKLVYTTTTSASITTGSWGYDFNTQIPMTSVMELKSSYEAEVTVSASSDGTKMPALVTGVVLNVVDSKIHANVLLYSPNTSLISGSYNVTLTVYDKR